jgi:hypothetical protein
MLHAGWSAQFDTPQQLPEDGARFSIEVAASKISREISSDESTIGACLPAS